MKTVGLFEAKTKLSEICDQVSKSGQAVVITRRGKPLVRIDSIREEPMTIRERRADYMTRHGSQEESDETDFAPPKRSREVREFELDGSS